MKQDFTVYGPTLKYTVTIDGTDSDAFADEIYIGDVDFTTEATELFIPVTTNRLTTGPKTEYISLFESLEKDALEQMNDVDHFDEDGSYN